MKKVDLLALIIMALGTLTTSCIHSTEKPSNPQFTDTLTPQIASTNPPASELHESLQLPLEALDEIQSPEEDEPIDTGGFCKDDVYAKYLTSKYHREVATQNSSHRGNSKALSQKQQSLLATNFAVRRFNGPVSPYFGGIPVVANEQVESWVRFFKGQGKHTFLKWMVRGESYRKILEPILREEGMPQEFIYLAMVESGFNNVAYSKAKATGTWQFMQGTAKLYGLNMDFWVDERRDPVKSTKAATRLLKDLYLQFGDWYLAMAAYNAGPGKVRSAIRRSGSRDFWTIAKTPYLRKETKDYVPKMLAALTLAADPEIHGFVSVKANPKYEFPQHLVPLHNPILIGELSQELKISEQLLRQWNPELIRDITPPRSRQNSDPYLLRLPETHAQHLPEVMSRLSLVEVNDVKLHRIRSGDTLSALARKYKVSTQSILKFNPKLSPRRLTIGREVAIPVPSIETRRKTIEASRA
jgi:membrane-bound lytic murein transglycosylase D